MENWNTPLINTLSGSDAAVLQQIFSILIAELQRLNLEIKSIKESAGMSAPTGILKLR